jgi:hypothetical protein
MTSAQLSKLEYVGNFNPNKRHLEPSDSTKKTSKKIKFDDHHKGSHPKPEAAALVRIPKTKEEIDEDTRNFLQSLAGEYPSLEQFLPWNREKEEKNFPTNEKPSSNDPAQTHAKEKGSETENSSTSRKTPSRPDRAQMRVKTKICWHTPSSNSAGRRVLYNRVMIEDAFEQMVISANEIENFEQKKKAWCKIAKALAHYHPDASNDIYDQILSIEMRLNEENSNGFSRIISSQSRANPKQALITVDEVIFDDDDQDKYRCGIAKEFVLKDPQHALKIADSLQNINHKDDALLEIVKVQAANDPHQASEAAFRIHDSYKKACALCVVAQALFSSGNDMDQANICFQEALKEAQLVPSCGLKAMALCQLAEIRIMANPKEANQLLQQALNSTQNEWNKDLKDAAFSRIAKTQALISPEQAFASACFIKKKNTLVDVLCEIAKANGIEAVKKACLFDQAQAAAASISDPVMKANALLVIFKATIFVFPATKEDFFQNALLIAFSEPNDTWQTIYGREILKLLSSSYLEIEMSAADIIETLRINVEGVCSSADFQFENDCKDDLFACISKSQASSNAEEALKTTNLIQNPLKKAQALFGIAESISLVDKRETHRILQKAQDLIIINSHQPNKKQLINILIKITQIAIQAQEN